MILVTPFQKTVREIQDAMPPRRCAVTPAYEPIRNIVTAAPVRDIKLPPFEEDMLQA